MRVASWIVVLCTVLGGVAVFLPSIAVEVGGKSISKRTELSLHTMTTDRALVRRMLAVYRHSKQRKLGDDLVRKVVPRLGDRLGRTKATLEDARDAMDTLDDLTDDDVRTAGTVFTIALWTLLGLEAVIVLLVFTQLMSGDPRRGRRVLALIAAILVALIAVALHVACREAVWEANDEVGHTALVLAPAAYAIPVVAILALFAAIARALRRQPAPRGQRA